MKNIDIYIDSFDPINYKQIEKITKNGGNSSFLVILYSPNCSIKHRVEMIKIGLKHLKNYQIILKYCKKTYKEIVVDDLLKDIHINKNCFDNINIYNQELNVFNGKTKKKIVLNKENSATSTKIRNIQSFNKSIDIYKYIEKESLYYIPKIKSYLSENRYIHSVSVANLSYDIALSNNIKNPMLYYFSGLLHDIGKELDRKKELQIMKKYFPEYTKFDRVFYHQFTSAYLCTNEFNINNNEIISGIKFHTTGNKQLSNIGKCIYAADKIEPTRGYDSAFMIKLCLKNLEKGFLYVLKENRKYYSKKNKEQKNEIVDLTYKYYLD